MTCTRRFVHVDTLGSFMMIGLDPRGARGSAMMKYLTQTETRIICADSDDHEP